MRDSEPTLDEPICFRLKGEVDGTSSSFIVPAGSHVVGTDPACEVVLTQRGVSRRHARLEVTPVGIAVSDLSSKNGSFINDREVAGRLALIGDELRFGPVSLRLHAADAEEAVLALSLDASGSVPGLEGLSAVAAGHRPSFDTTLLSVANGDTDEIRLDVLDAVFGRLFDLPSPDLDGSIAVLMGRLGALGGALLDWPREGDAVALAAAGTVGDVPAISELPAAKSDRLWSHLGPVLAPTTQQCWGVVKNRPDGALGLLFWGEPSDLRSRSLMVLTARLLEHKLPRASIEIDSEAARPALPVRLPDGVVRGESTAMAALYQQMALLLQGEISVLVLGETGVGKEHLAQALHDSSTRRTGPFIAVNCAAIPDQLLEAEMFGIGKGVATGVQPRRGKFSQAQGGTLLLDEIGDMPLELQAKLLRALQEKEIYPVGRQPEAVDVRVIAATNTDLRQRIREGRFREDLYYRLAGYVLEVPPLRQRIDDLPALVGHFLRRFCLETRKPVRGVTLKALKALSAHSWPGNVRELEHEVRRLVYLCPPHQTVDSEMLSAHVVADSDNLDVPDGPDNGAEKETEKDTPNPDAQSLSELDQQLTGNDERSLAAVSPASAALGSEIPAQQDKGLEAHLEEVERGHIVRALRRAAGNQSAAARLLKISRNGLAKRLKRLEIDASQFQV